MARVNRPKKLLQNLHNHVGTRLYGVLTETTLWILTTVSISIPVQILSETETLMGMSQWEKCIIDEQYLFLHSN
jgi:hypothetical protein